MAELTETLSSINPRELEQILELLDHAGCVQVAAVGNTTPVALDFAFKLNQLGIPAVAGTIWEGQVAYTFNMKRGDVLVVISNSGTSRRLLRMIAGAQENGCKVIAIANQAESPVARVADYHIATATREKLLLGEFCFSRVSATVVVETLYLFLAVSRKGAYDSVRRHEASIAEDKDV